MHRQNLSRRTPDSRRRRADSRGFAACADRVRRAGGEARPRRRFSDARLGSPVRRPGVGRRHRRRHDTRRTTRDQPVRIAGARARRVRGQPQQLRAGSAAQFSRLWRARGIRRARRAAVPGRHPADDAGRAGADRELQPPFRAAHRGAARPVFHAVRKRVRRRGVRLHGGGDSRPGREPHGERGQLRHVECRRQGHGDRRRRRVRGGVQQFRHGRLPRPLGGPAPDRQRQVDVRLPRKRRTSRSSPIRNTSHRRRIRSG